jgi:hypothetical protein
MEGGYTAAVLMGLKRDGRGCTAAVLMGLKRDGRGLYCGCSDGAVLGFRV